MADNKLFEIVNALNVVEKKNFSVFIKSSYHNRREDLIRLWEVLNTGKRLEPETTFALIYPEKATFDDAQWRHLQSMLLVCIEQFLALYAWEQTPLSADLQLASVYREKNLRKPLEHCFRRSAEHLEKMPRDGAYYHWLYQMELEKYAAVQSRQERSRENNLAAVSKAFDIYTAANKLRLACLTESHRAVYQAEYDDAFLPQLLDYVQKSDLLQVPIVALYFYCYQALTEGSEAGFRAFRQELEAQGKGLPESETRTFALLAINYCIRKLNTGERRYVQEAFDLYRIGLDTGALLENGHLSRFAFKNIVALAVNLEAFDWAMQFIDDYEPFLEEQYRAAHRDYNLSKVFFAQKNYKSAMPLLARVGESDLLLNLDSRVMLLKMYYEMGELDALDALLASFKILLLRRKKMIGYHSAHYLNTLRFIHKLVRLNKNDRKACEAFRAEIERSNAVIEKEWLLVQAG